MYKSIKKVELMFMIFLFVFPFVYSATPTPPSNPTPDQAPISQYTDTIQKIMQAVKKDISEDVARQMDENFKTLDNRIMENNKVQFRKAIFALLGGLAVVVFLYAYITDRINKRYELPYYEKMIESKVEKLLTNPFHFDRLYYPVTFSEPLPVAKAREDYFSGLTGLSDTKFEPSKPVVPSLPQFQSQPTQQYYQPPSQPQKEVVAKKAPPKIILYLLIIAGVITLSVLIYILIKGSYFPFINSLNATSGGR